MNIRLELFSAEIAEFIKEKLDEKELAITQTIDTKATRILQEIQYILSNEELSDFQIVEEIVCLFEKNNLSAGSCHDFG